jgi:hypothetical protein
LRQDRPDLAGDFHAEPGRRIVSSEHGASEGLFTAPATWRSSREVWFPGPRLGRRGRAGNR